MPVLFALVVLWLTVVGAKKVLGDSIDDFRQGRSGSVPARMEAHHGSAGAAAKLPKYGFTDHLRDNWRDMWARRTEAMVAARDAKDVNGDGRVSLRERWLAAKAVMSRTATKVKAHPVTRALIDPVGEPKPAKPAVDESDTPEVPAPSPFGSEDDDYGDDASDPAPATGRAKPEIPDRGWLDDETPTDEIPRTKPKEPKVTAPTGEAVNLSTAIAAIDAIIGQVRIQKDQAAVADRALAAVDDAIDGMQGRQRGIYNAARSLADDLAALNLNPAIIAPVFEVAEVLNPGQTDTLLQAIENIRANIRRVIAGCDAALAALQSARATLVGLFADAAQVVEEHAGGDSRFVGGENNATPAPTPANV